MAINYTYPVKTSPASDDDILIIDNADSSKATKRIAISTLPVSGGVTSIVAGTNVTITPSTGIGAVTINSSGGGSGTVTNVLAAPPLSSSGGITPTISMVSSDTSNDGYLLAADWNTFNQKTSNTGTVTSVTAASPLVSTGGATPAISLGGLSTLGTSSQIMAINSAGTGLEYVPQQVAEVVEANSTISKGDPLYVSGFNSGTSIAIVDKADASDPNKMPSVGIASDNISLGATGEMKVIGVANSINVNAIPSFPGSNPSVNDIIYVASGGGLTSIKPTGTNLIQNVAIVLKASANGSLQVTAIGRSNDLPNIPQGNIWLGDSNGVPAALTPGANNTVLTSNGTTASWSTALSNYLPLAGGAMTGPITTNSTFAGRNVATDGTKLDGVEALADVTDVANVTAAGALMESTITNVAQVKAFDSSDYATAAQGALATNALPLTGGTMTGAITSGSSITALQLIPADVTLVITMGTSSGSLDRVIYDTELGTFSNFDISASGIPIAEFHINSLTEGATAELFLTTTPTAYVQLAAWETIPSGGVATSILWPGGNPPDTSLGGVYKFTFTMAGGIVYGVADLAFA